VHEYFVTWVEFDVLRFAYNIKMFSVCPGAEVQLYLRKENVMYSYLFSGFKLLENKPPLSSGLQRFLSHYRFWK
jgi:hypothetical protein